jgi:hypothetical protein
MEVRNSAGLWARCMLFKGNQPRLVLLTSNLDTPADGFEIHHSPSLVITPSSSETESDSESTCTSSSSEPPDLISDSYEASEDSVDKEGRGTVAIVVAQITGRGLTAMPNMREKDVSISARNHEPDSFSQFPNNHERRPQAEVVPDPKLLVKAIELMANVGAHVDVPLEALLEEIGEGEVISHLVNKRATVKLAHVGRQPVEKTQEPRTLGAPCMAPVVTKEPMTRGATSIAPVVTEKAVTQGAPSTTPVLTENQKALAKLSALVPLTGSTALSATTQLSPAEWL